MLKQLMKAAKGTLSPDEVLEMLSMMGIEAEIRSGDFAEAELALAHGKMRSAQIQMLDGKCKDGTPIVAILVLPQ